MTIPTLVLIPGQLCDAELWRDQIAGLAGLVDCQVADITHGESLEELAQQILTWAPERFAVAGFSLGGYVALEIARTAPERIDRLALLDTSIKSDSPERSGIRRQLEQAASMPGRFHGFGIHLLGTYLSKAHLADEAIVTRIRAMTERLGPAVFVRQSRIPRKDGTSVVRSFLHPLLILCGEEDALTPLEDHIAMAGLNPSARLVVLPGCGHMTPIEAPQAVTAALRDWLA